MDIAKISKSRTQDAVMFGYINRAIERRISFKQAIEEYKESFNDKREYFAIKAQYQRMTEKFIR